MRPLARSTGLLVERLEPETIVYDEKSHQVHCLNRAAGFVWRQCDGKTTVEEIASRLPDGVALPADPAIVRMAVSELEKLNLLERGKAAAVSGGMSRRAAMRKTAMAATSAAVLLPAITSIVAPTPSMARSADVHDQTWNGSDRSVQTCNGSDRSVCQEAQRDPHSLKGYLNGRGD